MRNGKKCWYIPDGWIPVQKKGEFDGLEGHEALIVLNCNKKPAKVYLDFYFEDKDPILGVEFEIPAQRVKCFRMDHPDELGGVNLGRLYQYSVRVRSKLPVIVQFGRLDVTQENCAYIGVMGYSE